MLIFENLARWKIEMFWIDLEEGGEWNNEISGHSHQLHQQWIDCSESIEMDRRWNGWNQ